MLKLIRKKKSDIISIKPFPEKANRNFKSKIFNIIYESFATKIHNLIFFMKAVLYKTAYFEIFKNRFYALRL